MKCSHPLRFPLRYSPLIMSWFGVKTLLPLVITRKNLFQELRQVSRAYKSRQQKYVNHKLFLLCEESPSPICSSLVLSSPVTFISLFSLLGVPPTGFPQGLLYPRPQLLKAASSRPRLFTSIALFLAG